MQLYEHVLLREPEYLGIFELIFRPGFIFIMSLIWLPVIILLLIRFINKNIKNKKIIKTKKENLKQRLKSVA